MSGLILSTCSPWLSAMFSTMRSHIAQVRYILICTNFVKSSRGLVRNVEIFRGTHILDVAIAQLSCSVRGGEKHNNLS